jgi:hypothetical protein
LPFVFSKICKLISVVPFPALVGLEPRSTVFRSFCFVRFVNGGDQRIGKEYLVARESVI